MLCHPANSPRCALCFPPRHGYQHAIIWLPGNMMSGENALRIASVGLGTVGGGVIRLLETNRDLITRRAGRPITITAISARDRTKDRGVDLSPYEWVDDMSELAGREEIDAIVELIGGADGPALTL